MDIAILGATGKFGLRFTAKLLAIPEYQLTVIDDNAGDIFADSHRVIAKSINASNFNQLKDTLNEPDVVCCAASGTDLPAIAENLVKLNVKRLILFSSVGIYNELPDGECGEYNLDNEPQQIPSRQSADIIEESDVDYTILRLGFLRDEDEEYVISKKGEPLDGCVTTIESAEEIAVKIIKNPELYSRENIAITKKMC
ncbi:MAG: NAD(P)H-binding protein [Methanobrevibacter sp.]|nr:NAD(P)H-binding protein [Methanobrevibacter sp.]